LLKKNEVSLSVVYLVSVIRTADLIAHITADLGCFHILLEDQIRRIKWAGHVTLMGQIRNEYTILVRKLEGKRPLGKPRSR
jgi:hypothetical protein